MNEEKIKNIIAKCWNSHSDRVITKKDVYISIMNRKGALLGINGVSGYIEYSHGKFTTSITELLDLCKESDNK